MGQVSTLVLFISFTKKEEKNIKEMIKKKMMMMTKWVQHEKIPEKESSGWLPAALGADKSLKIADS